MENCLSIQTESDVRSEVINPASGILPSENDAKNQPVPDSTRQFSDMKCEKNRISLVFNTNRSPLSANTKRKVDLIYTLENY